MNIVSHERNYIPIDLETRFHACLRVRESKWKISKACSYYHVKRSSLFRWLKQFDGSADSLKDRSHRPLSPHPRTLSEKTVSKVLNLKRRNPDESYMDIWMKMRRNNYVISLSSVLRILKRAKKYTPYVSNAKKKHNKKYHTPTMLGEKWQMDVKFVPQECKVPQIISKSYFQYTILDECNRKRFLYFTNEHSMYETAVALRKAIEFFGYAPLILQTDNGWEFSDSVRHDDKAPTGRKYPNILESTCIEFGIIHKFIRPRTPEHNGKVERSHRIDQDKFYRTLRFYSLDDLRKQGKVWNKKYNNMPKFVLKCKTPNEVELELIDEFHRIREEQGQKSLTSIES